MEPLLSIGWGVPWPQSVGRRWFGWINASTHHDLHHATARSNYGLYFTWWDRWMGTEHPDYYARFASVARPSSVAAGRSASV